MRYTGVCDIGKVRDVNQDAILMSARDSYGIFAVADGIGGHSRGELASRHIIKVLEKWWEKFEPSFFDNDFQQMICGIRAALEQANSDIYKKYNKSDICGSTSVVLFAAPEAYGIFHAGDSRIYMQYDSLFMQLTQDEIWENQDGQEKPEDRIQNQGKLVNAVGINEKLRCTVYTDELKKGTVFMLCSDGLYQFCPETSLKKYLRKAQRQESLERCSRALLDMVYETKASDNISFIIVRA